MEYKYEDNIRILFYLLFLKYAAGQCDDSKPLLLYATSAPQYFTSPDYPNEYPPNLDCSWRVQAPSVYDKVIINVEAYGTGSGTSDYMDIYDGYNSSSTHVIRNPDNLHAFVSSSDVMFFTFISSVSFEYEGFQILYFSNDTVTQLACDQTLDVTADEQVLMSANLPDVYNEFHSCAWTFSSTDTILFQIKFLDMGGCGSASSDSLKFYDGNSTADTELASECSTADIYEFDDITTTGFVGHVTWTVTNQTSDYYGFIIVFRMNIMTTTSTTVPTTTLTPNVFDNCTASGAYFTPSISPNFDYIYSPDYQSGKYPKNKFCRWYITAPENYSVEAYFDNQTYAIESNVYCRYDYVVFYDGNSTSDTMLDKFCGFSRPTSMYRSSGTQMLIIFSSDYLLQYAGFRIRIKSVGNTYPVCKSDYTEYSVSYNIDSTYIFNNYTYINNLSSPNFGISDYPLQIDVYWLFTSTNTTHYKMVIDILSISIERAYGCIYDRLVLYDGPCLKDGVKDTVCGYWAKRWDLEGPEYLLQFHSDGYITRAGFQLIYYSELKSVEPPPTTTTTTHGPPVGAVVDAVKAMLTNYSNEDLPTRNLSAAIEAYIDFYLVGINGIDEVEQKMTSTGQFEVKWQDSSLSWDPTKRQGVVQVLLPQNDIWKPDIALMNGFTSITAMGAKFMFINVNYNGSCIWKPYQIMESVCKVDMTHYPYDRQTCVLKFGTWSTDDSEVITELGSLGLQIHPNFQENSEWRLISTETKQQDNNNHKIVEFFITIERNPRYVTFYMTMPLIVLAYMNVFTFVIPSESGEKTGYSITIFLSFVVLLIINNDSLPENSDTISLYAAFVLTMTILSAVALVVSVLQIRALTFEERRYPIANHVKALIRYVQFIQSVLTCRRKKSKTDDDSEKDDEKKSIRANSSLESNVNEAPTFVKKVSFKDDSVIESEAENDRYSLPNKRELSKVSFRTDRENTLFETNTLIRSATALSFAEKQSTENQTERRVSITKTVKFSDKEAKPDEIKNTGGSTDTCTALETSTVASGTAEYKGVTTSSPPLTKSDHILDQTVSCPPDALVNQSTTINEIQSPLEKDLTDHISTEGTESSTMDLYRSSPEENITPVKKISVSPTTDSSNQSVTDDKNNQEYSPEYKQSSEENIIQNQSDLQNDKHLQVTCIFQSDVHMSCKSKALQDDFEANIKSDSKSAGSLQRENDRNLTESLGGSMPNSLSDGVDSGMAFSAGNQSGSLAEDLVRHEAISASDFKTGRPSTAAENRPVSINTQVSLSGSRVVLADHGRAFLGGRDRPISRYSQRAGSALSHRSVSFLTQGPVSSLNVDGSTAVLFGDEEMDKKSLDDDVEINSTKSKDSSSESSESSSPEEECEENNLSWSDLVSCTDAVLFVLYLLITTVMTLAMFMTMIEAY